ncbi:MAG: hypothetical protein VKO64_11300 [Candidatus Sericytochromatia bacterium]|nr:hypothetical protein [Candidatus Sericytochromatia bacterium]
MSDMKINRPATGPLPNAGMTSVPSFDEVQMDENQKRQTPTFPSDDVAVDMGSAPSAPKPVEGPSATVPGPAPARSGTYSDNVVQLNSPPSTIRPSDSEPKVISGPAPAQSVSYAEPEQVSPRPRTIEVAGAGMGAAKKYSMLESEALAVYTLIRDNGGSLKPEKLKELLKSEYGIDADITRVDGRIALVNRATGNAIAVDTEGNGALGFEDLQFKEALLKAGIDPDFKPDMNSWKLAMDVITKAMEKAKAEAEEAAAMRQAGAVKGKKVVTPVISVDPAGLSSKGLPNAPTPMPTVSAADVDTSAYSGDLAPEDVMEKVKKFQELLAEEKKLQKFLLDLKVGGTCEAVAEQIKQHDEAVARIRQIRQEGIVPIVGELAAYLRKESPKAA